MKAIIILLIALLHPAIAQDNFSPTEFDPGAIWQNPAIQVNPVLNPQDDFRDHHILPTILNPAMMVKAGNMMAGQENDIWTQNALAWLENNSTENSSMFFA
jgi:hypothetical protein